MKLVRKGHNKKAVYNIVVTKKKGPGLGFVYDKIGYVDYSQGKEGPFLIFSLKKKKLVFWLSKGVGVSKRLRFYLVKLNLDK